MAQINHRRTPESGADCATCWSAIYTRHVRAGEDHSSAACAADQWERRTREITARMRADQEPLGAEFEAVWDANRDTLYEP